MRVKEHTTQITNVLVIGSGGAGLRAAIEVKLSGLSVTVLGKRNRNDVHTVLAAGGINACFGNVDKEDTWEQHFADTFKEGYGIGDSNMIKLMVQEAPSLVNEIDEWGANFHKLSDGKLDQRFFGAHTFRRTCYSGDYTGRSILKALISKANKLNIPIHDCQYVTDLLVKELTCFGAISVNTFNGERTVHLADAVIVATGGHTRIWRKSSSRINENTGDGFYLGLRAGCELKDMEMVQFHPTGMIKPEEIAGTLVTEAVRGEGGKLINSKGERFMVNYDSERMELSSRDKVAMANYTEIFEGRSTPNGGVYLDISHKNKDFILEKIPRVYRQFLEHQMLDISKKPMEVSPTAHYSMGGLVVTAKDHSTGISGLFAAGEVTGGLHGANRLGGNSLAEILVFGKRAGIAASKFSKQLTCQIRSPEIINQVHDRINSLIKNGNQIVLIFQRELSDIMWENCGVIRNEEKLVIGLKKVRSLKSNLTDIDVRIDSEGYADLFRRLDLEASICSAEATLISAIQRKESRGAHQRSDFPSLDKSYECSYHISLDNESKFLVKRNNIKILNNDLSKALNSTSMVEDFKGKLIE